MSFRNYYSRQKNHRKNLSSSFVSKSNFKGINIFGRGLLNYGSGRKTQWAMGLESHGICVPGHASRDLGPGLGLILLGRLGLGQISLGQSRDKNLWDSQIPSFGTTWDSQVPGTKILGTGSPVPCPSLVKVATSRNGTRVSLGVKQSL